MLVAVGRATRFIEYLADAGKAYVATVTLGIETDTYDAEGRVVERRDASHVTGASVEAVLDRFLGTIEQRPPAFSAISVGGKRLYALARQGVQIDVPLRTVTIEHLALRRWDAPVAEIEVDCSKGTYIRSLAHDIGAALGTGAHLSHLSRTRVGRFDVRDAVPLDALEAGLRDGNWQPHAIPPHEALAHLPAIRVESPDVTRLGHGLSVAADSRTTPEAMSLSGEEGVTGTLARAMGPDGRLIATVRLVATGETPVWRPEKVFHASDQPAG